MSDSARGPQPTDPAACYPRRQGEPALGGDADERAQTGGQIVFAPIAIPGDPLSVTIVQSRR